VVLPFLRHLETLEARLNQNASHSSRPLSTDAPAQKRQRKPGCKPGHPGHTQVLFEPTSTVALFPAKAIVPHYIALREVARAVLVRNSREELS
jgi:hypothetical protein